MKQTYIIKKIDELRESEKDINEFNKKANNLISQITIWDHEDFKKFNKDKQIEIDREEAGLNEETEYFGNKKSIDYSKENWERVKKGLPVKLPKVFLPRRLDSRNSIDVYGRKIYIVKKNENQTPTRLYVAYDAKTGIMLCSSWKRNKIEPFLIENLLDKIDFLEQEEKG